MYILADETCYENKSFKDLTPKQIEKHYLYRGNMNLAIYKEAEWYKKALAMWDSAKKNREYKGMSESQIRSKLINSDDDKLNRSWRIILRIIDRGIRPRDQIADEFDDNEYWWERKTMEPKGVDL
jgi:molecular chaperone DnaK (HSP70)